MDKLKGKRALITGGTSGIGLATARRFLAEGARVAVTGTNPATLEAARAELGGDGQVIRADAGDVAAQRAVAETIRRSVRRPRHPVRQCRLRRFPPARADRRGGFDRSVAVNLKGPFFLVQALLPIFANPASIVLNTSINARIGMPNTILYAATKAGLALAGAHALGRADRRAASGSTRSAPARSRRPCTARLGMSGADIDALVGQIPAGRRGDPDEIAQAMVFLASDEAAFTVGSELVIDGGMSNLYGAPTRVPRASASAAASAPASSTRTTASGRGSRSAIRARCRAASSRAVTCPLTHRGGHRRRRHRGRSDIPGARSASLAELPAAAAPRAAGQDRQQDARPDVCSSPAVGFTPG